MLSAPTVLVVGAGASIPYGYPSGPKLVAGILSELKRPDYSTLGKRLTSIGFEEGLLTGFREELQRSQLSSIDAFIEHRPEYLQLGKSAIAISLLPFENASTLYDTDDWYRYLINRLIQNMRSKAQSSLTILTFNYDRSLDFALSEGLTATLLKSPTVLEEMQSRLSIIHLHGQLSPLPGRIGDLNARPYGASLDSSSSAANAADFIKIIHEKREDFDFKVAQNALCDAERVCFLGLGYHPLNLERLGVKQWCGVGKKKVVIGTGFGLTDTERQIIERKYFDNHIRIGGRHTTCLEMLREHAHFLD
jgi:hypothetical protein